MLQLYLSIVPYNFDWVIVLCLDIIIFMYYFVVTQNIFYISHSVVQSGGSDTLLR